MIAVRVVNIDMSLYQEKNPAEVIKSLGKL